MHRWWTIPTSRVRPLDHILAFESANTGKVRPVSAGNDTIRSKLLVEFRLRLTHQNSASTTRVGILLLPIYEHHHTHSFRTDPTNLSWAPIRARCHLPLYLWHRGSTITRVERGPHEMPTPYEYLQGELTVYAKDGRF